MKTMIQISDFFLTLYSKILTTIFWSKNSDP